MHQSQRTLFMQHIALTTQAPIGLEVKRAKGVFIYDKDDVPYYDLISGIGVSNIGHCHPEVVKAVQEQAAQYMHLTVYGEYIYAPQVELAKALTDALPPTLNNCYFVNSGAEAIEGAMKLAKRYTGRREIISFQNAYHGSTHGALSIMGSEEYKNAYRPLLPSTKLLRYNNFDDIQLISCRTAGVVIETVQGEAGVIAPLPGYLAAVKKQCELVGALYIADEIQTGFGRTGTLFAFEQYNLVPHVLCIAKAMGGGMPIGAFVADKAIMDCISHNPILGHITTFGGHPVTCAAALANIKVLLRERYYEQVEQKTQLFHKHLKHSAIKSLRTVGFMMALQLDNFDNVLKVFNACIKRGVIVEWFLFNTDSVRMAPPLIITNEQIVDACSKIIAAVTEVYGQSK
jgi:acetylornithine/N-succinyldiaminopimelate aminotransferase